jgi:hypothetical protein
LEGFGNHTWREHERIDIGLDSLVRKIDCRLKMFSSS